MWPKEMKDLGTFSAKEIKSAAAEEDSDCRGEPKQLQRKKVHLGSKR